MLIVFKKLRWQLTFWFVTLTMAVYVIAAFFCFLIFKAAMTNFVDKELTVLTNELIPALDVIDGKPSLKQWRQTVFKGPYRYLPMIQLYNPRGQLIESYGPPGVPILFSRFTRARTDIKEETYHIRVLSVPLDDGNAIIGYLQLQLSLKNVDGAMTNFGTTMALIAPFLLLGFGMAGYFFSRKAARPVEESFFALQQFMADAGHELSTPISIILANAESLEADLAEDPSVKTRLETITRSSDRMNNLVRDMTLLAKMEGETLLMTLGSTDFSKLVQESIVDFAELFKSKAVSLIEGPIQPVTLSGDSESLKRLITNLLQNALKYTNAGGSVKIALEVINKQAKLTITDSGIGIPLEDQNHIFKRFYRVDQSRSRAAGGSGLGLSIVKAVIDAHKGKIDVQSTLDAGTTFSIFLPLK
jgi:OmpR-family two-component system manganese-sensing sensor histidine kinase